MKQNLPKSGNGDSSLRWRWAVAIGAVALVVSLLVLFTAHSNEGGNSSQNPFAGIQTPGSDTQNIGAGKQGDQGKVLQTGSVQSEPTTPEPSKADLASKEGGNSPTPAATPPPAIPHSLAGRQGICLVCHQTGVGGAPVVPDFHLKQNFTNDICLVCHQPGGGPTATTTPTPIPTPPMDNPPVIPHSLTGREGICLVCHQTGVGGASVIPESHVQYNFTNDICLSCHRSSTGAAPTPAPTPSPKPSPVSGTPPAVPHSLTGRTGICLVCHQTGVGGAPVVSTFHIQNGFTNDLCLVCHKSGTVSTPAVTPTPLPTPTPASGTPPTVPHSLVGREGICLVCHQTGMGGAPVVSAFHIQNGFTNDLCLVCHQPGVASVPGPLPNPSPVPVMGTPPAVPHSLIGREGICLDY